MKKSALIFGYNEYAKRIASQIKSEYEALHIYTLSDIASEKARDDGYNSSIFDLSDEWTDIEERFNIEDIAAFCTLENEANNIFLTISLRASFEQMYILALAQNSEDVNKLKIAGANKVLPIIQITANVISEILEKPVVTNVLHQILYEESNIKIAQITMQEGYSIIGSKSHDISFKEQYNILLLAVVDKEMSTKFIFTAKGFNHKIDAEDVLVVVGLQDDIDQFKMQIKGSYE